MATRKRPVTKSGTPRARKGVKLKPTDLGPQQLRLEEPPAEVKALEVARMYQSLAGSLDPKETEMELQFEEPALVTLGFGYLERGRLSGSVYAPILRKLDGFLAQPLSKAMEERRRRAQVVLAFDDAVAGAVARLKEKGFDSPYLKAFVVARVNPLRFMKGDLPGERGQLGRQLRDRQLRRRELHRLELHAATLLRPRFLRRGFGLGGLLLRGHRVKGTTAGSVQHAIRLATVPGPRQAATSPTCPELKRPRSLA